MKRTRAWLVVVLLAVVGVATVSWTPGTTVRFTDAAGAPAPTRTSGTTTTAT